MLETGSRRTGSKPAVTKPGTGAASQTWGAGHAAQLKILQLQKTLGNRAVTQLLRAQQSAQSTPPIQRVIAYDPSSSKEEEKKYPTTWLRMRNLDSKPMRKTAKGTFQMAVSELQDMGITGIDEEKLQEIWGKVAKANKTFNILDEPKAVVKEMAKRYVRSMKSKAGFAKRSGETSKMLKHLRRKNKKFIFKNSPQNPMMVMEDDDLAKFSYDKNTSKEAQIQKQLSTVLLHSLPEGVEAQAALSKDKGGVVMSTNINAENRKIDDDLGLERRDDILDLAADVLESHHLESTSRENAMKDHVMRHALKLYDRLKLYLDDDAIVSVPADVDVKFDGRHAEIRIQQGGVWNEFDYHLPTGTKYQCMGCRLYFHEEGLDTGNRMGGLWVTNSALSTQMVPQLEKGIKIGGLGDEVDSVALLLATQYEKMMAAQQVEMGRGKTKGGEYTFDRQADSESELDEADYKRIQEDIKKRKLRKKVKGNGGGGKPHAHNH
ncbi:hypothetical protein CBW65_03825 [Tumebacillus avium]|uniref:Uncharacterized protein n=1 Tax=Tumebacillus avium TaxID=1903704 RepID=A0A1Y0IIK4_9BACL|nr:hypothetical protein [Tumebacillus avium]ARU60287.1 hypothetical protein CBW65_03825 [Tumebacillus avium]